MKKILYILILIPTFVFASENADEKKIFKMAVKEIDNGNFPGAILMLEKALKENTQFDQARFQLAVAYHLSKKNAKALKEIEKIKTDPEVIQMIPVLKGNIFIEDKKWKEALEVWQKFPEYNPDLKALRTHGLAESYEGLGKSSEAAAAWSDYLSLQVKPTNDIFERIAKNSIKAGEKDKALTYCTTTNMLQGHKDYQEICKGYVYHASKDNKQAMISAQAALDANKENLDAKQLLDFLKKSK